VFSSLNVAFCNLLECWKFILSDKCYDLGNYVPKKCFLWSKKTIQKIWKWWNCLVFKLCFFLQNMISKWKIYTNELRFECKQQKNLDTARQNKRFGLDIWMIKQPNDQWWPLLNNLPGIYSVLLCHKLKVFSTHNLQDLFLWENDYK